jgi:sec-independent protein translocase protein TatA
MWDAPWHWILLAVVVIALFGYKKLPDASRAVGRSLRIFKTEIKGMGEDDKARDAVHSAEPASAPRPGSTGTAAIAPSGAVPPTGTVPASGQLLANGGPGATGSANGVSPAAPAAAATPAEPAASDHAQTGDN